MRVARIHQMIAEGIQWGTLTVLSTYEILFILIAAADSDLYQTRIQHPGLHNRADYRAPTMIYGKSIQGKCDKSYSQFPHNTAETTFIYLASIE